MHIGAQEIGPDGGVYVIAELGVNHDGLPERALGLIEAAAKAGADAVKFQLFEADLLMSSAAKLAAYQKSAGERDPVAMLRRLQLTTGQMRPLVERAHELGLGAIVTIFSLELVAQAQRLPWDAYKTASPDIIHRPLLEALMATAKPLIVSTGAATRGEVVQALSWLDMARDRLALLQCVSSYPTALADASIGAMCDLARIFDGPIGYSDHTAEADTSAVAHALGANILEKHMTYDRRAEGPDHAASLEPRQMHGYIMNVTDRWRPLDRVPRQLPELPALIAADPRIGEPIKRVLDCERDVRSVSRQSITTRRALPTGHRLTHADLTFKRPGTGIPPFMLAETIGRPLARSIDADTPLMQADLA